jgi:hypothetical protein
MTLKTRVIRSAALTVSAAWLAFVLPSPGPAHAADNNNWWNSMLGFMGMGPSKPANDAIDYSARPALVVPPKMDLPPPQQAVARPADWPQDPDAIARRKAEADSRQPAPAPASASNDASDDTSDQPAQAPAPPLPKDKIAPTPEARSAGLAGAGSSIFDGGGPLMLPSFNLSNLNPFNLGGNDEDKGPQTLKVGVEPPREYLTQPPPGYRTPVVPDEAASSAPDATDSDNTADSVHDKNRNKVSTQ